jgi:hypothetical protein
MKILSAIAFSLVCVAAVADPDPCMDSDVSPFGYYEGQSADELHLHEHGC